MGLISSCRHQNARLAPLHGVNAFKDYLQEKNVRRLPKVRRFREWEISDPCDSLQLITDVEQYRRDNPREVTTPSAELQTKRSTA